MIKYNKDGQDTNKKYEEELCVVCMQILLGFYHTFNAHSGDAVVMSERDELM